MVSPQLVLVHFNHVGTSKEVFQTVVQMVTAPFHKNCHSPFDLQRNVLVLSNENFDQNESYLADYFYRILFCLPYYVLHDR